MSRRSKQPYGNTTNVAKILTDRLHWDAEHVLRNRLRTAPQFVDSIELEAELQGHNGCVNCLQWSDNGRILASASDDFHVMLWDPFRHKLLHDLQTPHDGNIFSVKFLPNRGNSLLATGAGDCKMFVFDVNRQNDHPIRKCTCHTHRVKRLATSPRHSHVFWSAAEDGVVLQHDMRQHHVCQGQDANVLIDLRNHVYIMPEVKCIAVNPLRPEQLAIGANDIYTRLYDRRMISLGKLGANVDVINDTATLTNVTDSIPKDGCVKYFCPGHLGNKHRSITGTFHNKTVTYLTFSPDGTELLTNMGSDHIYLYDINRPANPLFLELPKLPIPDDGSANESGCGEGGIPAGVGAPSVEKTKHKFPPDVEQLKKEGNAFLEKDLFLQAINKYTLAIQKTNSKDCAVLYLNRATALMKRNWFGDVYAAIRDCHTALRLDPHYVKAHFRLARALLKLDQLKEAQICLEELIRRFPSYAKNPGVLMLEKDIGLELDKRLRSSYGRHSEGDNEVFSDNEKHWRSMAMDYSQRYIGHWNTKTDIKEANYFGDANYIVAGSDDGNFYIWNRHTGIIHSAYRADEMIVNCVQPHPYVCLVATSGIDHEVRLWTPESLATPREQRTSHRLKSLHSLVQDNQARIQLDPFDSIPPNQAICRAS
ncbi:WD and tetratricopeptide repeats protein 1 [Anopheles nili]|uniref:WD and tetratricopeptide repeats protein 1 n=1 Tax=Anopheles nili TaxID=185578 RepID=UPI00237B8795|nr:WD and tetratricopeptide repeats protein 1 [Anopheles nili]